MLPTDFQSRLKNEVTIIIFIECAKIVLGDERYKLVLEFGIKASTFFARVWFFRGNRCGLEDERSIPKPGGHRVFESGACDHVSHTNL